ncbi:hypothetical protein GCM10007989_04720 [Devosia pacifica]|uniref:DUF4238 domain-containing protein n=1 Tax=Devosia pacifica TaxID=1335967 RepID=A0A918VPP4_9HYPH|nr:DUF4238 domain-containing protein [Devosia pacifica]GHA13193.1 hypothetical protein GCM10007989_04720 [Devosia pacifica]
MSESRQNPAHKHHYIPAFYLKRWATGVDGKLTEFRRVHGNRIAVRRAHPNATGFMDRLYELQHVEPAAASILETHFFAPIDNAASDALDLLDQPNIWEGNWTARRTSAWSRFIYSLLVRSPEDVAVFRREWPREIRQIDAADEEDYKEHAPPGFDGSILDLIDSMTEREHELSMAQVFAYCIDSSRVAQEINNLHWSVYNNFSDRTFLTSDRPVIRTAALLRKGGHLLLPIGPRKLFLAATDDTMAAGLSKVRPRDLVAYVNQAVTEGAANYVYAVDERQSRFIHNRFGKTPQPRLIEAVFATRRERSLTG